MDSNVSFSVPCYLAGSVSGCVDDSVVGIALGSGLVVWNLPSCVAVSVVIGIASGQQKLFLCSPSIFKYNFIFQGFLFP